MTRAPPNRDACGRAALGVTPSASHTARHPCVALAPPRDWTAVLRVLALRPVPAGAHVPVHELCSANFAPGEGGCHAECFAHGAPPLCCVGASSGLDGRLASACSSASPCGGALPRSRTLLRKLRARGGRASRRVLRAQRAAPVLRWRLLGTGRPSCECLVVGQSLRGRMSPFMNFASQTSRPGRKGEMGSQDSSGRVRRLALAYSNGLRRTPPKLSWLRIASRSVSAVSPPHRRIGVRDGSTRLPFPA